MGDNQTFDEKDNQYQRYEIRLKGHLDDRWAEWFEGLTITLEENGDTLLTGSLVDQAALHGSLRKVRDLGLSLVSVNRIQSHELHPYRAKKEIKMITNRETTRNLLDVRIILAVLWAAGMLSSLNGDTYRLSASTEPLGAKPELLLVMAIMLVGSIFMSALTLMLKPTVSRWANRIAGIFYAMVTLVFWVLAVVVWRSAGYEMIWSTAQLVFALLVVWYAWKWTNPGA